jgi:exopolyphosphatase/guanosine-5'-triphosphate,3'-diphosphate pyrophosphatase
MQIGAVVGPDRLHGLSLQVSDLEARCAQLAQLTIEERRKLPGLNPDRADIILAGTILLIQALSHIRSDRIDICTRGLRWGLLYDRFLPSDLTPR